MSVRRRGSKMNEKIAIMTDSTSDIPKHIVDQYDIQVVPLRVLEYHCIKTMNIKIRWT